MVEIKRCDCERIMVRNRLGSYHCIACNQRERIRTRTWVDETTKIEAHQRSMVQRRRSAQAAALWELRHRSRDVLAFLELVPGPDQR
jgi:hypothetical protein